MVNLDAISGIVIKWELNSKTVTLNTLNDPLIQNFYSRFYEAKTCIKLLHYYHTANNHWKACAQCYEIQHTICNLQYSKCKINIPAL